MKIAGFLLLLTGWLLVLAAVVLLAAPAARSGFVLAGAGFGSCRPAIGGAG